MQRERVVPAYKARRRERHRSAHAQAAFAKAMETAKAMTASEIRALVGDDQRRAEAVVARERLRKIAAELRGRR